MAILTESPRQWGKIR